MERPVGYPVWVYDDNHPDGGYWAMWYPSDKAKQEILSQTQS